MDTLEELFEGTLRNVYYAEKQIPKLLPKMAKKATSEHLAEAFRLDQTQSHIERLEKVLEIINAPTKGKKCDAIQGTIMEAEGLIKKGEVPHGPRRRHACCRASTRALQNLHATQH